METIGKSMLRLQIGPVQDFIAAARTTRDLWSGSYLLSRLMAAALLYVQKQPGTEVIFPKTGDLSICRWWNNPDGPWVEGAETPCLSNKMIAYVPTEQAEELARKVQAAVHATWHSIAAQVWGMLPPAIQQDDTRKARYDTQVRHHLSVDYAHLPLDLPTERILELARGIEEKTPLATAIRKLEQSGDSARYAAIYYLVDHCLNGVRKVNNFEAWNAGKGRDAGWQAARHLAKDALTGKEEQILRWHQDKAHFQGWEHSAYLSAYSKDVVGAITLIKRLWYLPQLGKYEHKLPGLNLRYGPNDQDLPDYLNHYYAVLAMDGDHIGAALTREPEFNVDAAFHSQFSSTLAAFAQQSAGRIVQEHGGILIYAGGDDVLALLPLSKALECARRLGVAFRESMAPIREGMTVSAGLAFVHSNSPLQDAVAAARKAEGRAKSVLNRGAFSISVMKRSGEIAEWGAKWDSGACELLAAWQDCLSRKLISAKGAHRYAELLTPYLNKPSELVRYQENEAYSQDAATIAMLELNSMLERQWLSPRDKEDKERLRSCMQRYISHLLQQETDSGNTRALRITNPADELVPLCSVIAFYGRNPNQSLTH